MLAVMRSLFIAIGEGDRKKVRKMGQLILDALREKKRDLVKQRKMIEAIVDSCAPTVRSSGFHAARESSITGGGDHGRT